MDYGSGHPEKSGKGRVNEEMMGLHYPKRSWEAAGTFPGLADDGRELLGRWHTGPSPQQHFNDTLAQLHRCARWRRPNYAVVHARLRGVCCLALRPLQQPCRCWKALGSKIKEYLTTGMLTAACRLCHALREAALCSKK